jgi:hypothetical protein
VNRAFSLPATIIDLRVLQFRSAKRVLSTNASRPPAGKNDAILALNAAPHLERIAPCETQAVGSHDESDSTAESSAGPSDCSAIELPLVVTLGSHCNTKVKVCAGSRCVALVCHQTAGPAHGCVHCNKRRPRSPLSVHSHQPATHVDCFAIHPVVACAQIGTLQAATNTAITSQHLPATLGA